MEQYNLSVRQGATLSIKWENDEPGGESATLTISNEFGVVLSHPVSFDELEANLSLSAAQTESLDVGTYSYMITIEYEDGTIEKYPDISGCDDCTLPELEVCVANDVEEAS